MVVVLSYLYFFKAFLQALSFKKGRVVVTKKTYMTISYFDWLKKWRQNSNYIYSHQTKVAA